MRTASVIIVLLVLLAGAIYVAMVGWSAAGDVVMPPWGWLMMSLGIAVSLLLGFGLMALVFYSSRQGYDDRAGDSARMDGDEE